MPASGSMTAKDAAFCLSQKRVIVVSIALTALCPALLFKRAIPAVPKHWQDSQSNYSCPLPRSGTHLGFRVSRESLRCRIFRSLRCSSKRTLQIGSNTVRVNLGVLGLPIHGLRQSQRFYGAGRCVYRTFGTSLFSAFRDLRLWRCLFSCLNKRLLDACLSLVSPSYGTNVS